MLLVADNVINTYNYSNLLTTIQGRRKDFLIGGAQSETTHRVVSNLYNNL